MHFPLSFIHGAFLHSNGTMPPSSEGMQGSELLICYVEVPGERIEIVAEVAMSASGAWFADAFVLRGDDPAPMPSESGYAPTGRYRMTAEGWAALLHDARDYIAAASARLIVSYWTDRTE